MIKDFVRLVVKDVESFNGKEGQIGVIEYYLRQIANYKEKSSKEDDFKELEKLINYLELKKVNIGG